MTGPPPNRHSHTGRGTRFTSAIGGVLRVFTESRIRAALIGGSALLAHGLPVESHDLDWLLEGGPDDVRRLRQPLEDQGFWIDETSYECLDFGDGVELRVRLGLTRCDLICIREPAERDILARATVLRWCGQAMKVATLPDVVLGKLRWRRNVLPRSVVPRLKSLLEVDGLQELQTECLAHGLSTQFDGLFDAQ